MRVNKYLAHLGIGSRRAIDELINSKRIMVNGVVATLGQEIDETKDIVELDGKKVSASISNTQYEYYALNKPRDVLSSAKDDRGRKCVVDFIPSKTRLYPVGRLDYDSTGLIILTNDGELANLLTHPKYHVEKEYIVEVSGKINREDLQKLELGIDLNGKPTRECKIDVIDKNILKFTLKQGMKRQIKLMCASIGLKVKALNRIRMGNILLENLRPGEYRTLSRSDFGL